MVANLKIDKPPYLSNTVSNHHKIWCDDARPSEYYFLNFKMAVGHITANQKIAIGCAGPIPSES